MRNRKKKLSICKMTLDYNYFIGADETINCNNITPRESKSRKSNRS